MKTLLALIVVVTSLTFTGYAFGDTFITDTLAPGGKAALTQGYRFITDTLAPGGGPASTSVRAPAGFSWSDAGVGAGTATGVLLALIGSVVIVGGRRSRLAV